MTQDHILVGVGIGSDVGLDVAPRHGRELETEIRDDAIVLRRDLILVDVEVRIIHFARSSDVREAPALARGTQVILRIIGGRPYEKSKERSARTLE